MLACHQRKEAFQQAFVSDPKKGAVTDVIITGWPDDIKVVPHLLCPYWQLWETLTVEDSLVLHGEALIIPIRRGEDTTATPPVPSRNHQSTVVHSWMCLLAVHKQDNRRSSLTMWDLHLGPGPKCCSIPHSNANSIWPIADMCHRHLHLGRNWLLDMQWLLFKDEPHPTSSIWPEQHHQSCLTAQRDVLRAWNSQSTLLWQWPSVCKCTVYQVLHLLEYHTWDLKPSLPTIKWTCRGMCKICEACTPTC